ncbi:hypothetical protein Ddye_017720 [Dipteronia dyeriana]|uniref:Uncharacterized protein n=1 Tax=Dipteronia dyeriana TaxID=168575 RepID=A0AAD9U985_9ROSI|nr:hypothetical protein Ddye_017720 [Dipteronia dyeriana]
MPSSVLLQSMLLSKPRVENLNCSRFKSPESMLLSKPRVENFHGSRIKSAEFIVSPRFSGFKFSASACSNLKVKSFMHCSVKVTNSVKSTACSSTSKIATVANFGEAKENCFEKVLIDRILKVVMWMKIPTVVVLLLVMTLSGLRGDSALAASSVVMSNHRSISSSSDGSSSALINGQHRSPSPVLNFLDRIIFLSVLVYLMNRLDEYEYEYEEEEEDKEIIKLSKTKSSYSMITNALRETAGVLRDKYMPFINNDYLSVKGYKSREDAAAYYLKLSKEEQGKFNYLNVRRKLNCEKTNTNMRGLFNNAEWTHIVVTILVAAKGPGLLGFPNNIGCKSELDSALMSFERMSRLGFAEIEGKFLMQCFIDCYGVFHALNVVKDEAFGVSNLVWLECEDGDDFIRRLECGD